MPPDHWNGLRRGDVVARRPVLLPIGSIEVLLDDLLASGKPESSAHWEIIPWAVHSRSRTTVAKWSGDKPSQSRPQLGGGHPLQFALPDRPDPPSQPTELAVVRHVALPVALELLEPKFRVGVRHALHAAVEVPEASPDLQGDAVLRQKNVRAAGKLPDVQAEAKAQRMEGTTNPEFGARVLRPYAGHVRRPLLGCDPVSHRGYAPILSGRRST